MNNVTIVKEFFKENPKAQLDTKTLSLGNNAWCIIVFGIIPTTDEETYLFDLVGSNGTHSEADDLWSELNVIVKEATGKPVHYVDIY